MIRCFITLCLVANPHVCKAPLEIMPEDHPITSPMECARGGFVAFAQDRMAETAPDGVGPPQAWFPKVNSRLEGDGSDIVRTWVAEEKDRARRLEPQIK